MKKLLSLILAVVITATAAVCALPASADTGFSDVGENRWSASSIGYAVEKGYMNGVGDGRFDPAGTTTRAMVVTVLWRREGEPEPDSSNSFSDVPAGKWYSVAVAWAKETGIVNGITETVFDPDGPVTREQLATMLHRFSSVASAPAFEPADLETFDDSSLVSAWAAEALGWVVGAGLVKGTDNNRLAPGESATREQFATIIERYDVTFAPEVRPEKQIPYRLASKEEGVEMLMSKQEYHDGFSQNDLDFRLQATGRTMEDYLAFTRDQVLDFTEKEKALIEQYFNDMELLLDEKGFTLPPIDEIVIVKTTMKEEGGAGGYTHGTHIFISEVLLTCATTEYEYQWLYRDYIYTVLWHELFHCLTRSNPDFRKQMYSIIHFTVEDEDYLIPPSVQEYFISNPDVGHHDSHATFIINGEPVECFTALVTTKHFENPGESFFDFFATALVPVDGTDIYYFPEDTENFYDVFGNNTGYVIDPEECLADNFAYAMRYGLDGGNGAGYPNPEIISAILEYLTR